MSPTTTAPTTEPVALVLLGPDFLFENEPKSPFLVILDEYAYYTNSDKLGSFAHLASNARSNGFAPMLAHQSLADFSL
jgi:hypothetical protein